MNFLLVSTSPIKTRALESIVPETAITAVAPGPTYTAQPIGIRQAKQALLARISTHTESLANLSSGHLGVAIENFIEKLDDGTYVDKVAVLLVSSSGLFYHFSNGDMAVRVPTKYAAQLDELVRSGRNVDETFGELYACTEGLPASVSKDWFQSVHSHNPSRSDQIAYAVKSALLDLQSNRVALSDAKKHENWPSEGVTFVDMFSLTARGMSNAYVDAMEKALEFIQLSDASRDLVIFGLESRGLMLGFALASRMHARFVPVRKPGKLPGGVVSKQYAKEYGHDTFEIAKDHLDEQSAAGTFVIVDDIIATGGSICAVLEMLAEKDCNKTVVLALDDVKSLRSAWRARIAVANPHAEVRLAFGD